MKPTFTDRIVFLTIAAFVLAVVTGAHGAVIDRPVEPGDTVEVIRDGEPTLTIKVNDAPVLLRLPRGDDVRLVPTTQPTPPPPPPPPPPTGDVIRKTIAAKSIFSAKAEGPDATWDMHALPDGTPARRYYGPYFAWAFDAPGTYRITVTPGRDYEITVTPAAGMTYLKLAPGRHRIRRTLTVPTHVIAEKQHDPPIIEGGFNVAAPGCYFENLIFDGDTNVNGAAIDVGVRGSAYVNGVEFRRIGNGIRAEFGGMLGVVARHVKSGSGASKYPFAMFGGHDFALYDFEFKDYRGIEHCIRIDANNGAVPRNGIIAFGTAARANDNKEPLTIRRAEDLSVHDVTFRKGYAVRLFYAERDYLTGTSRNVSVRRCTFDAVPLYVYWWGSDGLAVGDNKFVNLGGDAAIHFNGGKLRNVRTWGNWRDGSGPMHKGNPGMGADLK